MILQYSELAADLTRIKRFLANSAAERQSTDQRRFGYIACVSALYSTYENFAERTAYRFCEMLLANPSNVDGEQRDSLRRRYVKNSAALLGQSLGVGRYREVTELDVAASLASCLDETATFNLRLEVMALHGPNLRWDHLAELFRWALPDLQSRIRNSDAVEGWLELNPGLNEGALMSAIESELNDLVERRNEVAHRAIPDEFLSYDGLIAKVDFIDSISLGLVASLSGHLISCAVRSGACEPLGTPEKFFHGNRTVIFPSIESAVAIGDAVAMKHDKSMRWGRIVGLMVDEVSVSQAEVGDDVGVRLDFSCRDNGLLYSLRGVDSELTSLPAGMFGRRGPFQDGESRS